MTTLSVKRSSSSSSTWETPFCPSERRQTCTGTVHPQNGSPLLGTRPNTNFLQPKIQTTRKVSPSPPLPQSPLHSRESSLPFTSPTLCYRSFRQERDEANCPRRRFGVRLRFRLIHIDLHRICWIDQFYHFLTLLTLRCSHPALTRVPLSSNYPLIA